MAYHKSAKKRIRQTIKRTARNRTLRSSMRTAIKKYRTLLEQGDAGVASEAYPKVQKTIDKMVTKGILHRNTASRYKSRLSQALGRLSAPAAEMA